MNNELYVKFRWRPFFIMKRYVVLNKFTRLVAAVYNTEVFESFSMSACCVNNSQRLRCMMNSELRARGVVHS